MVKQYQDELNEKKNSIIADLDSKEKRLIGKVKKNPRIWKSESLHFKMITQKPRNISSGINLYVELTQVCFSGSQKSY